MYHRYSYIITYISLIHSFYSCRVLCISNRILYSISDMHIAHFPAAEACVSLIPILVCCSLSWQYSSEASSLTLYINSLMFSVFIDNIQASFYSLVSIRITRPSTASTVAFLYTLRWLCTLLLPTSILPYSVNGGLGGSGSGRGT